MATKRVETLSELITKMISGELEEYKAVEEEEVSKAVFDNLVNSNILASYINEAVRKMLKK